MHLITLKALIEASLRFPQHKQELLMLGKVVEKGYFPTPDALRKIYPSLDNFKYLDKHYVINIAGNELRLIALIFFASQKFYIRNIMTHSEYIKFTEQHRGKKR
ncbi:mRNA interferase HigB [Cedecea davisae]|uniref:Toxin-antitoxin system, toxin component, RelE family n=1 Tax=Cedecea davisae DSM 4568 TaxID=566551 RepID=S3IYT8_9ENTR|nr:type II toxin-antitoxin system HigB family toxin [Cedecea davisae]EPF12822.1 toxin-antitoxin system, toxin component, RelE family [Cedecea davisae DSM 4568]SUX37310.1 mRNA interferase HigB [Cedecea davisae]